MLSAIEVVAIINIILPSRILKFSKKLFIDQWREWKPEF